MKRRCFLFLLLAGCASNPDLMPEPDYDTDAPGAAMVDFSVRKPMNLRKPAHYWEFYYKHCSNVGNGYPVGANAWDCNGAFW